MIHYSVDTEPRSRVHFWAAIAAAGTTAFLKATLATWHVSFDVPTAFAVYGLYLYVFNKWLWKSRPFSWAAGIPDISGHYKGTVSHAAEASGDAVGAGKGGGREALKETPVTAVVTQTWTQIDVVLKSDYGVSNLTVCGFFVANDNSQKILCSYQLNETAPGKQPEVYGVGSQELFIERGPGKVVLNGSFYSTKKRRGQIRLTRKERGRR
jgi:hypothetical protein